MHRIGKFFLFTFIAVICSSSIPNEPIIFLRPNTTQLFTELYQNYGLIDNPAVNVFEDAFYLDQTGQPPILPLQLSNQTIYSHAERVLRSFHENQKNLELFLASKEKNSFFYTTNGSIQIIFALVHAIAMSEPDKKFLFVEKIPYYSGHENSVGKLLPYPNARFQGFRSLEEITLQPEEVLVEFVTSPNNPDGKFRKPFTEASILIADFVFASPVFGSDGTGYLSENLEWVKKARSDGKHLFSFNSASKQFGKTGCRCGYLWYPMSDPYAKMIFKEFFHYISSTTVAGSSVGLSEFLDLISAFLTLPDTGEKLREDGRKTLAMRHNVVEKELLARYPGSTVTSIAGSPTLFAQINDSRLPQISAATIILQDTNTSINPGTIAGDDKSFVRLNLSGYTEELLLFTNRLAGSNKYSKKDLFFTSKDSCHQKTLFSEEGREIAYVAKPGDCHIHANASKGPIQITLPPFINYRNITLTIKKVDESDHPVTILYNDTKSTLNKQDQALEVEWNPYLFQMEKWKVRS